MRNYPRTWAAATLVIVTVALTGAIAQEQGRTSTTVADKLVGTWRLVSIESSDKEAQRLRGLHPTGLLTYDRTRHMAAQIMPDRKRRIFTGPSSPIYASPAPTPDEANDALLGYTAYFGTYSVDERSATVTHRREGNINPGALGNFVRRYKFISDDKVQLIPLENEDNLLTWERIK